MPLPRVLARISRRGLNPFVVRWAGRVPGYGVLEHVGRHSGRRYRTPLLVLRGADGVVFVASYWPRCDWARNVLAADGATLVHRGRRLRLLTPRVLEGDAARAALPRPLRPVVQLLRINAVLTATPVGSEGFGGAAASFPLQPSR